MIRRYPTLKPSQGTVIAPKVRLQVRARDQGCVGPRVGMERECFGQEQLDHVRASGGLGMKSPSTSSNLATLRGQHHYEKTIHGREWRPKLLAWIEERENR